MLGERTRTINQARALILTRPDDLRARFARHSGTQLRTFTDHGLLATAGDDHTVRPWDSPASYGTGVPPPTPALGIGT